MKKTYIIIAVFTLFVLAGCQSNSNLHTTVIRANSMICGSCAKNVEKAITAVDGVAGAQVDLKTKTVEVKFDPVKTSVGTIEDAVTNAGYDANDKKRNPEAYDKLEKCCKIDG
ncbi:MAG TPA: heavy metal-associated domain-containing protein [Bacteroidota bacterium]|nr:heavy metal-associated domain-containing protein [Bacteroidota bacterium]